MNACIPEIYQSGREMQGTCEKYLFSIQTFKHISWPPTRTGADKLNVEGFYVLDGGRSSWGVVSVIMQMLNPHFPGYSPCSYYRCWKV